MHTPAAVRFHVPPLPAEAFPEPESLAAPPAQEKPELQAVPTPGAAPLLPLQAAEPPARVLLP